MKFYQGQTVTTVALPPHHEMIYPLEMDGLIGKPALVLQEDEAFQDMLVLIVNDNFYSWPAEYCRPGTPSEEEELAESLEE
jgi:hypothetical protein